MRKNYEQKIKKTHKQLTLTHCYHTQKYIVQERLLQKFTCPINGNYQISHS